MGKISRLLNPDMAARLAILRVCQALERAEAEQPHLAAPDGTAAVQIDDLRALITEMDDMRDTLALAECVWRPRWHGSEPERGSAIVTAGGGLVAYFGGDEKTHEAVQRVVSAHNVALVQENNRG